MQGWARCNEMYKKLQDEMSKESMQEGMQIEGLEATKDMHEETFLFSYMFNNYYTSLQNCFPIDYPDYSRFAF